MRCPSCGHDKVRTYDVRQREDGFMYVVRVKRCPNCGHRFRTIEVDLELFNKTMQEEIQEDDAN
jgi:transcriptional regulator NrdR family protein